MADDQFTLDAHALSTVGGGVSRNSAKPDRATQERTRQLLTSITDSIKELGRNSQGSSSSQLLPMMLMMSRR